jgi:hypothetical protein
MLVFFFFISIAVAITIYDYVIIIIDTRTKLKLPPLYGRTSSMPPNKNGRTNAMKLRENKYRGLVIWKKHKKEKN